jgi:ABC-type Mn2+/Zn2+ transport system ATPase subunit
MSTVERLNEAVRLTDVSAYGVRFPDLIVRSGEVVVLSGPNGSGKSTISRVLVGDLAAEGRPRVLGAEPFTADLKSRIGFLVKDLETMGSLTSRDVLDICAAVRDCGTAYAHELAARLGLDLDRQMARLSRGQLRRLGIVQALMHQPELIVLDDPTTELDDEAREVLRTLLREAATRGAAVLLTAQAEADAETFADRIVSLGHVDEDNPTFEPILITATAARIPASRDAQQPADSGARRPHSSADDAGPSVHAGNHRPPHRPPHHSPSRAGHERRPLRGARAGLPGGWRAAASPPGRRPVAGGDAWARAG